MSTAPEGGDDAAPTPVRRYPRSVYEGGHEPDPRFSLANERTFLAWIRSGLALTAGGVALEAFSLDIQPGFRLAASVLLLLAGLIAYLEAWTGWKQTERAMRHAQPLPHSRMSLPLAVVGAVATLMVLLGIVTQ